MATRSNPPRWIWNSLDGIKHFGGLDAEGQIVIGGHGRQLLNEARDQWCRDKGCWRPGTKTCIEATNRPCDPAVRKAD